MTSYRRNFGEILSIQGVQELLSTETLSIVHGMPLATMHYEALGAERDLRDLTAAFTSATTIPSGAPRDPVSPTAQASRKRSASPDLS